MNSAPPSFGNADSFYSFSPKGFFQGEGQLQKKGTWRRNGRKNNTKCNTTKVHKKKKTSAT